MSISLEILNRIQFSQFRTQEGRRKSFLQFFLKRKDTHNGTLSLSLSLSLFRTSTQTYQKSLSLFLSLSVKDYEDVRDEHEDEEGSP